VKCARPERMSGVDASFLVNESDTAHMHIGALLVCSGDPPELDAFREQIAGRLDLIPRFGQRLAKPAAGLGRPFWVDDPDLAIDHHVRALRVDEPGTNRELGASVGEVFSAPLDHARPLWELWLLDGVAGGRFAVIYKAHHALADGIADVQLGSLLFDLSPDPTPMAQRARRRPESTPGRWRLARFGLEEIGSGASRIAQGALGAARRPRQSARRAGQVTRAVAAVSRAYLDATPDVPLNCSIGPERLFEWRECELEELRLACNALGGTLNDGVLTVAAGALGRWSAARGLPTAERELRALVPISIRRPEEWNEPGNRLAAIRAPLPIGVADPAERFRQVHAGAEELKRSKQPLGAQIVSRYLPQLNFSTRLFNLLVTNLPGPEFPLYVSGAEVEEIVPIPFLAERHALAIASLSYNGRLYIGLIADLGSHPQFELETIGSDLERSLHELLDAAGTGSREQSPAPS
jgi:diacylglycerol O-acyltransferase